MLALPSGQVLYSNFNSRLTLYTPDGAPNPAWSPAVSGLSAHTDGSFQVSGTQFNGLSEGAYYGDDASESSNYPLVRLTDGSGVVTYARTFKPQHDGPRDREPARLHQLHDPGGAGIGHLPAPGGRQRHRLRPGELHDPDGGGRDRTGFCGGGGATSSTAAATCSSRC